LLAALTEQLEKLLLELGRGVQIDLAGERDHVGVVSQLFRLDVEVHRPPGVSVRGPLPVRRGSLVPLPMMLPRSGSRGASQRPARIVGRGTTRRRSAVTS